MIEINIPPKTPLLHVSFDADQVGQRLAHQVETGQSDLMRRYGPNAGSVYFEAGGLLYVLLTCYGDPQTFFGFRVVDATLACRLAYLRNYNSPTCPVSPFTEDVGCVRVDGFEYDSPRYDEECSKRARMRAITNPPLSVGKTPGAWMVSLTLTVQIYRIKTQPEIRVFTFDPEFQVGNGSSGTS